MCTAQPQKFIFIFVEVLFLDTQTHTHREQHFNSKAGQVSSASTRKSHLVTPKQTEAQFGQSLVYILFEHLQMYDD